MDGDPGRYHSPCPSGSIASPSSLSVLSLPPRPSAWGHLCHPWPVPSVAVSGCSFLSPRLRSSVVLKWVLPLPGSAQAVSPAPLHPHALVILLLGLRRLLPPRARPLRAVSRPGTSLLPRSPVALARPASSPPAFLFSGQTRSTSSWLWAASLFSGHLAFSARIPSCGSGQLLPPTECVLSPSPLLSPSQEIQSRVTRAHNLGPSAFSRCSDRCLRASCVPESGPP